MKVCSKQITHRMRHGLVALAVANDQSLKNRWEFLCERAQVIFPDADVKGVLVEEMVGAGPELFVGIKANSDFGPVLALGIGGFAAEIVGAVHFARLPLNEDDASGLLVRSRLTEVLASEMTTSLTQMLVGLSDLWEGHGSLIELDCNPVVCAPEGPVIADALALTTSPSGGSFVKDSMEREDG
jgi:hypothetical protein